MPHFIKKNGTLILQIKRIKTDHIKTDLKQI